MYPRRTVVKGLSCLSLAAVLGDPSQVRAAAAKLDSVSVTTPGGRTVGAALAKPATLPAAAVVLIHEWWGLNDQIKAVAQQLAELGYLALAVDLMGGRVATTPEQASAQMAAVDPAQATETLVAWISWMHERMEWSGKLATMGWCFGGGWALRAALATPVDATVVYYGQVTQTAEQLASLKGPVLGHFADRDKWITPAMVEQFRQALERANQPFEIFSYDADHAFANPTGRNYDSEDAQVAWERTLAFLSRTLGG
ncbi:MAG: dienelactone hydrolase family protein [Azospirillum sp.]|nr:dienelactone hydrolase family protein [Azospirillum sp.]